jgi:hypothetical protein
MTQYVLEILDGDRAGETVRLGQDKVTLGRKAGCTLVLHDEKVSGRHAEVAFEEGRYVLRDLGSTNGTLLDGRRVDEVALTAFDTFQVGRVRIAFKAEGAEAPAAGLELFRLDTSRAPPARRRSGLGLALAVVAAAGVGGWFYWQGQRAGDGAGASGRLRPVARVAGDLLPDGVGACEDGAGWALRAAGAGFDVGGPAHSGEGALQALAPAASEGDAEGDGRAEFALARTSPPLAVAPGQALRLTGWVRTSGEGRGALRLRFSSSASAAEQLWAATAPQARDAWAELACETAVPPGMDLVEVEALALLPAADAEVLVDDLALVRGGDGAVADLTAGGCNLVATPASLAVRAGEVAVLGGARPLPGEAWRGLGRAGELTFAEVGATLEVTGHDRGFAVEAKGGDAAGVVLLFPSASAAAGVRVRQTDGPFALQPAAFELSGPHELLLGSGPTRVALRAPGARGVAGRAAGDAFAVTLVGARAFELLVAFEAERSAARAAIREAKQRLAEAPGAALDQLRALLAQTPHDDALAAEAERLQADTLVALRQRLEELRAELAKAEFFGALNGYRRIAAEVDALVEAHGEHNLPDPGAVQALRDRVGGLLAEAEAAQRERRRGRLEELATVFSETGEPKLEALVRGYLERHGGDH